MKLFEPLRKNEGKAHVFIYAPKNTYLLKPGSARFSQLLPLQGYLLPLGRPLAGCYLAWRFDENYV